MDNYLHISPYAYCNWNPIKNVDPDGYFPWWAVAGAAIDYGFQVYDNYGKGESGFDAWIGDVNFIQVGLSAVNPTGKFAIAKTLLVEGAKALTKGSSLNSGININENMQEVAQDAILNTAISSTIGKIVDAGSDKAVNAVNNEMKTASKQLKTAEHRAQRNPNSIKKETQLENAKGNIQNTRTKQVRAKMLHSTVGQNPEASQIILNKSADRVRKSQDND